MNGASGTSGRRTRSGGRSRALAARCIGALTAGYLVVLVAAAVILWWGGDRWWPGTVLLFGPRWVLGLPFVVLLPLALWLAPPGSQAVLGVGALVYLFPIMGLQIGLPRFARPGDLEILTVNVASATGLDVPLAELVARSGAHLVAVQECPHELRDPPRLEVEGYRVHTYMSLCFLSRLPFRVGEAKGQVPVQIDTVTGQSVRYEVEAGDGSTFSFTNVHLPTPRAGLEHIRRGQLTEGIEELRRYRRFRTRAALDARRVADGGTGRVIVVGDFNAPPESRIQRGVWGDLRNAFSVAGYGFGHTRYNGWIRARIDHALVGPEWTVVRAAVEPDVGSDHRPVRVRLRRRR